MELVYFILAAYGLTQVLVYGSIFNKVRPSHHFFHCPMCIGFWSGALLFSINTFTELFNFEYSFANFFILSWLASGTSYTLCMIFGDKGVKYEHTITMDD